MGKVWRNILAIVLATGLAAGVWAQSVAPSENSALVTYLENALSTPGRVVKFQAVTGELSSNARIGEITLSDQDGVWLRVTNAQIDWTRSALLSGVLKVNDLKAGKIEFFRQPKTQKTPFSPEAISFSVPQLPVEVNIGNTEIAALILGQPILGMAATLRAKGRFRIDSTGLSTKMTATRTDGPGGDFGMTFDFARLDGSFNLSLLAQEPNGGLLVHALAIDGQPSVSARMSGKGKLDDATIDLTVSVDQKALVTGRIGLTKTAGVQFIDVALDGQIGGLVPTEYRGFFAGNSRVRTNVEMRDSGGFDLREIAIDTANLHLAGRMSTLADGFPETLLLEGQLGGSDNKPVVLPFGSAGFKLKTADLKLDYGNGGSDMWALDFSANNFEGPGFSADIFQGQIKGLAKDVANAARRAVTADIKVSVGGITSARADVAQALGKSLTATGGVSWLAGTAAQIKSWKVVGDNMNLLADGAVSANGYQGTISAQVDDLKAFQALLPDHRISGKVTMAFDGLANPVNGQIDGNLTAMANDLKVGDPRADGLMNGQVVFAGQMKRDGTGITVQGARLNGPEVAASVDGFLSSTVWRFDALVDVADMSIITPALNGRGHLTATGDGNPQILPVSAEFLMGNGISAKVDGLWGDKLALNATLSNVPLALLNQAVTVEGLTGSINGSFTVNGDVNDPAIGFDAALADVDATALKPMALGAINATAKGMFGGGKIHLDRTHVASSNGILADGSGDFKLWSNEIDFKLTGQVPLVLANYLLDNPSVTVTGSTRLDVHAKGSLTRPDVTGWVDLVNAAVGLPDLGMRFDTISTRVTLNGATASLQDATARIAAGGTMTATGQVGLTAGFPVNLALVLSSMVYHDGDFLSSTLDGQLSVSGDMTNGVDVSGQIAPKITEVTLNSAIGGTQDLTIVRHRATPSGVTQTLRRAGLLQSGKSATSADTKISLTVTVNAPNRIFVRGRGLDSELGGTITLTGPINDVKATGQFDLLRGRLDFLGRRLELTQGSLAFSGPLEPGISFASQTSVDGTTINLNLIGDALTPEISLTSSPDLPQDEILAKLIFGRDLSSLSPVQIASLASAVAELSGRSNGNLVEKLRRSTGLDNLDIRTNDSGQSTGVVGKYLDEKIYSEVEVDSNGKAKVTINLDVSKGLKAQGGVDSQGNAGVGIFFQKDY